MISCPHDDAPHGGLACRHVEAGAPVLAVFRYLDGEHSFTCGLPHDPDHVWRPLCVACSDAARLAHPEIARLPRGFAAWREDAATDVWRLDPVPAAAEDDLDLA